MKTSLRNILEPIRKNGILDVSTAVRKGRIVKRSIDDVDVRWLITNINDEIQAAQSASGFYELAELQQLRADIGPTRSVLDVGANIGNHSVFFVRFFGCTRLIAVEPYLPAYQHLLVNLSLNLPREVDLRLIGSALSKQPSTASLQAPSDFNIGLTKVAVGVGDIEVTTGNDVVGDAHIDLIKIDVEGMELDVLEGLTRTIERDLPAIFVEVSDRTKDEVSAMLTALGYHLKRSAPAYASQFNLTFLAR